MRSLYFGYIKNITLTKTREQEGKMREHEVSLQRRVDVTRPRVWLRNELSRVGLAEFLCTYVMMVRTHSSLNISVKCDMFRAPLKNR